MDHQIQSYAYQLMYQNTEHSKDAKRILELMYTSNNQYFTIDDLSSLLHLSTNSIQEALNQLIQLGEIKAESAVVNKGLKYSLHLEGIVQNLKQAIQCNKTFTDLVEAILDNRDHSNQKLNHFLESFILFNSEVADFTAQRLKAYFDENRNDQKQMKS